MVQNEKGMEIDVREKAEYVAPQLVRIADIAQLTENRSIGGLPDGISSFS